eukprot:55764_1
MTARSKKKVNNSGFGHLIDAILTENNGKILAKYKKQTSKQTKDLQQKHEDQRTARKRAQERREMMDESHVMPKIEYNAKQERVMRKTATFGVVALFKAIAKHQRDIKRSLDGINVEDDVLQKKTMKIEQESTKRLMHSLNEASSKHAHTAFIQTPNARKRRRLNDGKHKMPKHLQSVLVDKRKNTYNDSSESDSDFDDKKSKNTSKQWSVLDENMMIADTPKTKREIMDEDSEFEDFLEDSD